MSKILLILIVLSQLSPLACYAADLNKETNDLSELIHKHMFVEKKKSRQMSILIDPFYENQLNAYRLNLKTFHFHDKSTIKYDRDIVLNSDTQIDIPINFKSKPIDIPVSLSAECTHKLFPNSDPIKVAIKDKSKKFKLANGKEFKLLSINNKSFKFSTPQNSIFSFKAYDKKGQVIVETDKNEFSLSKQDKSKKIYTVEVILIADTYKEPLQLSLNFDSVYAKKIDTIPSDTYWTREDFSKRTISPVPSLIDDTSLESLNYKLIEDKIVFCQEDKAFSFKEYMNIINDESIVLLGDSYIKKLTASYFEDNFIKTIDLNSKEDAQLAIIKSTTLAPSEQLLIEVDRKEKRGSQSISIEENTSLEVQFNENRLSYQFVKNGQVVDLAEITPFPITFEAVYNKDGIALQGTSNDCYWGYPQKLVLSIPVKAKTKSIDQIINIVDLSQEQEDQLLSNYDKVNKVAEVMASIHSLNNLLPQENGIIFSENLAALHYLNNNNNSKVLSHYQQDVANSDPKGQKKFKYEVKAYMGYYITVNNKIETTDSNFLDIQKLSSSKDYEYNGDDLDFLGMKKKDWGLIAIPVDPSTMPHLYSNYEQYYKFFDKQQDAKPSSVWKSGWSSL
ncbi:hypothetical protein PQO01_08165 [Lentisphaera marina]|uniref:hypothetical protein n=1 Tax=Lentisphaera marina TaxID=1111041 RepID=UPI002366F613|nr:hypothetical protein [Lentisphaera marina]MDD7984917.1 hypothetical protein [Lentisphaera marina]